MRQSSHIWNKTLNTSFLKWGFACAECKWCVVRPARALGLKPSIFGTLVIGSDRLPFRIQIPTMSLPYISPSIAPPISPSLRTHTHTLSLSPPPHIVICYLLIHPHVAMDAADRLASS